ncbi:MAG: hypothetical protein HOP22_06185 [Nitrospiraceae bacterium]|nr:hypothetical protein [Nitrospiraceae bacterium]
MNSIAGKVLILAALSIVLGSSPSCVSRPNLVIHQSDALSVVLREMPSGRPSLEPHNHPYRVPSNVVLEVLASLDYGEGSLLPFSQGQPRRVFSRGQAELLAPELSKALGQALPQEVAAFSVADEDRPDRLTKGLSFVLGDELHLIVDELRKPSYQGEQQPFQQPVSRWELIPGSKQRHYATRPGGKGMTTNWIITPLR